MRRPPRSPPFPYTTLFRSLRPRHRRHPHPAHPCVAGGQWRRPGRCRVRQLAGPARLLDPSPPLELVQPRPRRPPWDPVLMRSEEHTSELQSRQYLVCRLLLDAPPPEISPLSLHDALPISAPTPPPPPSPRPPVRCWRAMASTRTMSSSPARRPCSITRPIASSGAGTAATATPAVGPSPDEIGRAHV